MNERRFGGWLAGLCCALSVAAENPPLPERHDRAGSGPDIHGLDQAQQRADGALVVIGTLGGTGPIDADHVVIEGSLSPGHSPGCISFGGDVTFSSTATLSSEIGGLTPCTQYDRIDVAGTLTINGATLAVILIDGLVPGYGDRFDLMNWGSIGGTFGTIDTSAAVLPAPLAWDTSSIHVTGELIVDVTHFADGDLAPWDAPDGTLNAADLLIAAQLTTGMRTAGALQLAHGDINSDGFIDMHDLLAIRQLVLP